MNIYMHVCRLNGLPFESRQCIHDWITCRSHCFHSEGMITMCFRCGPNMSESHVIQFSQSLIGYSVKWSQCDHSVFSVWTNCVRITCIHSFHSRRMGTMCEMVTVCSLGDLGVFLVWANTERFTVISWVFTVCSRCEQILHVDNPVILQCVHCVAIHTVKW